MRPGPHIEASVAAQVWDPLEKDEDCRIGADALVCDLSTVMGMLFAAIWINLLSCPPGFRICLLC